MDDAVPHPQPRRTAVISTSSTRRLTAARVLRRTHVAEQASWVRHKFRKEAVTRELAHGYVVGIGSDNASTTEQSGLVSGPGHHKGPGLVDRLDPLGAHAALGHHQHPDRLHGAVPALRRAAGPAGLGCPRSADSIQRVRPALTAAVLPVGAVHLDDTDTSRGDRSEEHTSELQSPCNLVCRLL